MALLDAWMQPDVLLASGPTGATDEVWVEAIGRSLLSGMSKDPAEVSTVVSGELVGLLRISSGDLGRLLARRFRRLRGARGPRQAWRPTSSDALVEVCPRSARWRVHLIPDLLWGEVDYESHYHRVRDEVYPRCCTKEAQARGRRQASEGGSGERP